ncbi:ion channel [Methylocystis sp. MJC1]|uniref:ion channel n=1 Tax=Methylocystis sp. MJC1 TaxID=2654282 RepID=UPI0013EADBB9|nr:ion channel [Methylocystis sp. MJC1]KAF2990339.1 Inward rectifier potassium channel Kirbac3.1 [Methylocystis sp. MJC1]MBU6528139.1 potassium transporter [Methylocystis sp. MJC1]UZX11051.1 ion channel [Methylocystis sp. MJC1]
MPFDASDKLPAKTGARSRRASLAADRIVALGLRHSFWLDLHHRAVTARWPTFFAAAAAVFVLFNLAFTGLYLLGDDPIANARPGSFIDYFFFSVETFATVGYGDMHPRTYYGHALAAAGAFIGVCALAVTTGLVFTRFARPRARILFARTPVLANFNGAPTLMIRFANQRHNMILDANAELWLLRLESSAEGALYRRFHRLALTRDESPIFSLSWTIMHVVDAASPLHGLSSDDLAESEASLILIFEGQDETSSQTLRARMTYPLCEVAVGKEYVDILGADESGAAIIDYALFHETRASGPV